MGELEQMAVQTFSMVPEIYQQAFRDAGADFPDELVSQIKQDPNQAVELLSSDKNLLQAVVEIYKNNQEAINQYAEQAASQTGIFKKGGKLAYGLEKFQKGGKTPKYQTAFAPLPEKAYNENGVEVSNVQPLIDNVGRGNGGRPRTITYTTPTTQAQRNHMTNYLIGPFLKNFPRLDTSGYTRHSLDYWYTPEGVQAATSRKHSIEAPNFVEVRKCGGRVKRKK